VVPDADGDGDGADVPRAGAVAPDAVDGDAAVLFGVPLAVSPEAVSPEAVSPEAVSPEAVSPDPAPQPVRTTSAQAAAADRARRGRPGVPPRGGPTGHGSGPLGGPAAAG
jgi:hypothetical protein